jgi:hypothetical protein
MPRASLNLFTGGGCLAPFGADLLFFIEDNLSFGGTTCPGRASLFRRCLVGCLRVALFRRLRLRSSERLRRARIF